MKKKIIIGIAIVIAFGVGFGGYMYFMPHRDVQAANVDESINAKDLVEKFLTNKEQANKEYLAQDGESKILVVNGTVYSINKDAAGNSVVLLKNKEDKMGVSCTFTPETENSLSNVSEGSIVKIKGVIRSGAEYDEDLDLAEDVIMEKCAVVN